MKTNSETTGQLSSSQRVLLALKEARSKLEAVERSKHEPIAIIGMSCRFPGEATNPEAFWKLLQKGEDAITEIPSDRWNIDTFYDPDPDSPGKMNTRYGGFLQDVSYFAPQFFGISPREALSMDPQHRLLLEVSWEALETAGQVPESLKGSNTGIFVGITSNDYARVLTASGDLDGIDAYFITGNSMNAAAGRLSYLFGFHGPSMAIDTACSSSLVAIHEACQSLRSGESHLALAGGVNLLLSPEATVALSRTHLMSPDGRCKTFDASANGYVRGEGCGIIVLKRLSDALADQDHILALIRGTAINQDGPSSGLTVPHGPSQQALLRQAMDNARISPSEVDYIEAHGTGTSLGDPIEIRALGSVMGEGRSAAHPLLVGSVKTNIGHLESAAGIAGLSKIVLALQHRELPQHLHLKEPNPHIPWDEFPFIRVTTEHTPWPSEEKPRIAGVSSFGASGTNAHIILEEAPGEEAESSRQKAEGDRAVLDNKENLVERPLHILTLSAKTEPALRELTGRYAEFLPAHSNMSLENICYTSHTGRSHFTQRLGVTASSHEEMQKKLSDFAQEKTAPGIIMGRKQGTHTPKIAFLFTGQGSQYAGMGQQLYETEPLFRSILDRCDEILCAYLNIPLLEVLYPQTIDNHQSSIINQTAYTQPAIFALEYALAELWKSWGITPAIMIGHSIGEYAAACVAGVFSLEDALKLVSERGRLMQNLPKDGEMVAVMSDEASIADCIRPYARGVSIAAVNGPSSVVISGKSKAIQSIVAQLAERGIKTKSLQVSHAFHSPLMEPMLKNFEQTAREVTYAEPNIPILSDFTGQVYPKAGITAEYWCQHIRQPVRFLSCMETVLHQGFKLFLEVGATPVLSGLGRRISESRRVKGGDSTEELWGYSLRKGRADWQQMLENVSHIFARGISVDWDGFHQNTLARKVILPTYPFQRQRYWSSAPERSSTEPRFHEKVESPLLASLYAGDVQKLLDLLKENEHLSEGLRQHLPEFTDVLTQQFQEENAKLSLGSHLYKLTWRLQPFRIGSECQNVADSQPGTWIILTDQNRLGNALAKKLQQYRHRCLLVYHDENAPDTLLEKRVLEPNSFEAFELLFKEVLDSDTLPIKGIIHLWGIDSENTEDITSSSLGLAQRFGCGSILALMQALVKTKITTKVWCVTKGAVAVESYPFPLSVAQSPLWGLGRVIAMELPALWGGLMDLSSQSPKESVQAILDQLLAPNDEKQIAFRDGRRFVARLIRSPLQTQRPLEFGSDTTYLITGGLGALGLQVAQWMVTQGVRHLVLTGRRGATSETSQKIIAQLQEQGVEVAVLKADVAKQEDVNRTLNYIKSALPPLRGIIHAAGVLDDGILIQQTWERFNNVMAAKVQGSWNLHIATKALPLDLFVCFSSIASLLGSPGQGNYAAANAFMDSLAHYRHSLDLPAISINWGPWAEAGMAAKLEEQVRARWTAQGVEVIELQQGMNVLELLSQQEQPQIGALQVEWSRFLQQFPVESVPPILAEFTTLSEEQEQKASLPSTRQDLKGALQEAGSDDDRRSLIISYLKTQAVQALGLPDSQIEIELSLNDLGLDSLMAVELSNRAIRDLDIEISMVKFMEGGSIASLTDHILEQLSAGITTSPELVPSAPVIQNLSQLDSDEEIRPEQAEELLANLDHLSPEQIEKLLDRMNHKRRESS